MKPRKQVKVRRIQERGSSYLIPGAADFGADENLEINNRSIRLYFDVLLLESILHEGDVVCDR